MLDTRSRSTLQPLFDLLAQGLIRLGLSPVQVTLMALGVGMASALAVYFEFIAIAVALLWLSGLLDVLDGTIARLTKSSSPLGTVMDIVFDRIVEIGILIAVAAGNAELGMPTILTLASIIISMTVFLTVGAVADNTGNKSFYYQPGLIERTEGFIMLTLIVVFPAWRGWLLLLFAALVLYTAGQRFAEAMRLLK